MTCGQASARLALSQNDDQSDSSPSVIRRPEVAGGRERPSGSAPNQQPVTRYADGAIAYQIIGDGPVDLVLAPGFISHLDLAWTMPPYVEFIRGLAQFARVIVFDKRGSGLSEPSPYASDFERRMEDIEIVMDAAGAEDAVLFGMSEGGPLTALYAAAHPQRVRALVLYGTFARGDVIPAHLLSSFDEAIDNWGEGRTCDIFLTAANRGPMVRRFTALFERASTSPRLARELLESIRNADVVDVLPSLDMPTLVLHRRDDPFAMGQWSQEVAGLLPDARFVVLGGSDHLPWMGGSSEVVDCIGEFLGNGTQGRQATTARQTILFTDIVDSTPMAVGLGDDAWAERLRAHNQMVRDALGEYGGTEIKNTGDGFLAAFPDPSRAAHCASQVVGAVRSLDMEVRCGLHTGPCEIVDVGDLAGVAVHVAARVNSTAGPSEVLATSAFVKQLDDPGLNFCGTGARRLKGIPGTTELFTLVDGDCRPAPAVADPSVEPPVRLSFVDRAVLGLAGRAPGAVRRLASLSRPSVP